MRGRSHFSDCHPKEPKVEVAVPVAWRAYSNSSSIHPDSVSVGSRSKANSAALGKQAIGLWPFYYPPQQSAALDNHLVHLHIKTALERRLSNKERYVLGGQEVQG